MTEPKSAEPEAEPKLKTKLEQSPVSPLAPDDPVGTAGRNFHYDKQQ